MKKCHQCQASLPDDARFCQQCGAPQVLAMPKMEGDWTDLDLRADVPKQFLARFFAHLAHTVAEEQDVRRRQDYAERVYESGFRDTLARRAAQWGAKVQEGPHDPAVLQAAMRHSIADLTDYFMVRHCADLHTTPLPEAILRYQGLEPHEVDRFQMVLDYLDFAHEQETVYTDFLSMPVEKLRQAGRHFLFPAQSERIFLICDQSLFGSCKEGFALTERALYWKAHFEPARAVAYTALREVRREENWLSINGFFFNVNPGLNVRMMKLLRRLAV